MKPIKILPHHAISYFEVYYLNWKPEEVSGWYKNEEMKNNGVSAINKVISNPNQLIQIVSSYDEFCRMCPHNKGGGNYNRDKETACSNYDSQEDNDDEFIEILGLENLSDGKPVSSKQFFESMKPTYEKLMKESYKRTSSKKKSLREIFRVKPYEQQILNLP